METLLTLLPLGKKAKIVRLEGGKGFQRNLRSRGIREGKTIEIVTRQPIGGPIVVSMNGDQVALGRGMACRIIVAAE